MTDYATMTLAEARQDYLDTSTTAMPIGGFIAWSGLSLAAYLLGDALPAWSVFTAAALPFPLAIVIDKLRGGPGITRGGTANPVTQLFMRFIAVVGLFTPLVIIAAQAMQSVDFLILGMALLAGMVWVPHGWGADDPAGFRHFVLRAVVCYAAYLLVPDPFRGAGIAAAAAVTYLYAIAAMRKPSKLDRH